MTPTISALIFISVVFAAAAALRVLIRITLVLVYVVAEIANVPRRQRRAPLLGLKLPIIA